MTTIIINNIIKSTPTLNHITNVNEDDDVSANAASRQKASQKRHIQPVLYRRSPSTVFHIFLKHQARCFTSLKSD